MAERKFLDFLDRFDGGGAGQSGDKFEGGGLLSALGNLLATPYGSEDERRAAARRDFYSSQNIGQPLNTTAASAMTPTVRPQVRPFEPNYSDRFALPSATPAPAPGYTPHGSHGIQPTPTPAPTPAYTQPYSLGIQPAPPPLAPNGQYVPPPSAINEGSTPLNAAGRFVPPPLSFEGWTKSVDVRPNVMKAYPQAVQSAYEEYLRGYHQRF